MQVGMVLAIAAMRMEHHDVATPERLASDLTVEVIQTWCPAAHERTQHDRRVLVESRAEHGRHRQDDVPIDDPLVEDLAHLTHPVVDMDFGAPQAQRRLPAHRYQVLALATVQTAVLDVADLFRSATREHFRHQASVIGGLIARMGVLKRLPMIGKDLLEDTPVPRGCCQHRIAPSGGDTMGTVQRLYHTLPAQSTPSSAFIGHPPTTAVTAYISITKNENSYAIEINSLIEPKGPTTALAFYRTVVFLNTSSTSARNCSLVISTFRSS